MFCILPRYRVPDFLATFNRYIGFLKKPMNPVISLQR